MKPNNKNYNNYKQYLFYNAWELLMDWRKSGINLWNAKAQTLSVQEKYEGLWVSEILGKGKKKHVCNFFKGNSQKIGNGPARLS